MLSAITDANSETLFIALSPKCSIRLNLFR